MFNPFKKKSPVTDSDKFRDKELNKIIRNIDRLKKYFDEGNLKGVSLQTRYLEGCGVTPPATIRQCEYLKERLRVERQLLE